MADAPLPPEIRDAIARGERAEVFKRLMQLSLPTDRAPTPDEVKAAALGAIVQLEELGLIER